MTTISTAREELKIPTVQLQQVEALHPNRDKERRFGRNISYGIQQTVACFLTDFIDPIVGKMFQKKVGNKEHEVTDAHVWGGEVVGDSAAFFLYMAIKQGLTKQVDALTDMVKSAMDKSLTKLGKKTLKGWAQQEHLAEDSPRYVKALEAYKSQQAENTVDSSIIAAAATATNVGFQKALGNKQAIPVILGGKLVGAFSTLAAMFLARTGFPTTMESLDNEMESRYVTPITRGVKKLAGVKEDVGERYDNLPTVHVNQVHKVAHNSLAPQLDMLAAGG